MRPEPNERAETMRQAGPRSSNNGFFVVRRTSGILRMQVSDGAGWDHVSVSLATRTPTWDEMCWVKRLWFLPEEVVMQLHPAESDYVNFHKFCLHLWRPQSESEIAAIREHWGNEWVYGDIESPGSIPLPPTIMVGPTKKNMVG